MQTTHEGTTTSPAAALLALVHGEHSDPHSVLGPHSVGPNSASTLLRAFHPHAVGAECVCADGRAEALAPTGFEGLFEAVVDGLTCESDYRLRWRFPDGHVHEVDDPYRFAPTIGELDVHLFNEGNHRELWKHLGAHARTIDGVHGVAFAVWAPNARRVSVVGDFCSWDGRVLPMRQLGSSGIFELFVPGLQTGHMYKYEIRTHDGHLRLKTDPYGRFFELAPGNATRLFESTYAWEDADWMTRRAESEPRAEPMAIYEVHLGSWKRVPEEGHRPLGYREIAPLLVDHVQRLGFTHIELMPIMEHPFSGSWGYQVSGYFAPTARFGDPDDFRFLVDYCHQHGIGVILDWVPAHFPKDDFALRLFDGSALYEHEDPRRREHPDWDTLIFNYGRNEVRNFLLANALYWLQEFHVDGLRVDAVASMIYRDYSRSDGQWAPNAYGGKEDLEALDFIKTLNAWVRESCPGCITVAEESTAWSGVTRSLDAEGLGFTFKWNMGWMHDTLKYFAREPVHRAHHHHEITFAALYEDTEHFVMPLSHDEVVHRKGSMLAKMPGDEWQRFANLRLLFAYQFTRPGKKLMFMGSEMATPHEWDEDMSLDWHLAQEPLREGMMQCLQACAHLYKKHPCLWRGDADHSGFRWIHCDDAQQSVLSYLRSDGDDHVIVLLNLTPVPRVDYRIGTPSLMRYRVKFNSDDPAYGGSGLALPPEVQAETVPFHGSQWSLSTTLPPLAAVVLEPVAVQ